jgi:hypothetical protein
MISANLFLFPVNRIRHFPRSDLIENHLWFYFESGFIKVFFLLENHSKYNIDERKHHEL